MTFSTQFQLSNFSHFMTYHLRKFFSLTTKLSFLKSDSAISLTHRSFKIRKVTCQQECNDRYWQASLPTIQDFSAIQERHPGCCIHTQTHPQTNICHSRKYSINSCVNLPTVKDLKAGSLKRVPYEY